MYEFNLVNFGELLRQIRLQKKLTQDDVAEKDVLSVEDMVKPYETPPNYNELGTKHLHRIISN